MKKNLLSLAATIMMVVSSLSTFAQGTGNQPSGNLIYGSDGNIYGVYMKTLAPDNRTATIYKYTPGSSTIDPLYRFEDHAVEIYCIDGEGFIFGIAIPYDSNNQPTRSKMFAIRDEGRFFNITETNTNKGVLYHLAMIDGTLYGLRSGGGHYNAGAIVFGRAFNMSIESVAERPTSLLTHYAMNDISDLGIVKGEPMGFWRTTTAGGAFGKGSVKGYDFYNWGLDYYPSGEWMYKANLDFTGYGGGALDGEGPVSIVNDLTPAIYAVTERGGANNQGAIFHINGDGNFKLYDFEASSGRPFGKPFVEAGEGKLIGAGGNAAANTSFIYAYNRQTNTYTNVALFDASSIVNGVTSVVAHNGVIYGTSRATGNDAETGSLFAINQDGTNAHVIFKFIDGYTRLLAPYEGQTEVAVIPALRTDDLQEATSYRIEISENADFSGIVHIVNSNDGLGKISAPGLKYSTKYYARVKTNAIDDYGTVTTFTTHAPEKYSFVSSPSHGAANVALNGTKVTANVVYGATSYTIELNTQADFTGTSIVKTSAIANQRTIIFDELSPSTTYYTRTKTNFPSDWGPTRSFTTAGVSPPPVFVAESREINVYPNPFEHNFTVQSNESEELNVTLVDLTGRELIKAQVIDQPATLGDQLAPGIYLLRIKEKDGTMSVKRMVKK